MLTQVNGLVVKDFAIFQFEQFLILNSDGLIFRKCSYVLFAHTNIDTCDTMCVERLYNILELCFVLVPLHFRHIQVYELSISTHQSHFVFFWTHTNMFDCMLVA